MRILLPQHQAGAPGGIGTVSRGLARELPRVLADRHELLTPGAELRTGIGSARSALRRLAFEQVDLPRIARDADLVHLPDHRPLIVTRCRQMVTVHDVTFIDHPEWFTPASVAYKRVMLRALAVRRPAAVMCVSRWSRDRLLEAVPQLRACDVRVVPPAVRGPAGVSRPDARMPPYFLTVASIEPRKNHLGFLEAFRESRRAGLDARWIVVGGRGTCGTEIQRALRDEPGVTLAGYVTQERLEELYAGALAVTVPSHAEGFGLPVLEAMVRGTPVVCSRGSGLEETAGHAALTVAANDVDGWADALTRLAGDAALREDLRRRGCEHAASFSWDATVGLLARWYDQLGAART